MLPVSKGSLQLSDIRSAVTFLRNESNNLRTRRRFRGSRPYRVGAAGRHFESVALVGPPCPRNLIAGGLKGFWVKRTLVSRPHSNCRKGWLGYRHSVRAAERFRPGCSTRSQTRACFQPQADPAEITPHTESGVAPAFLGPIRRRIDPGPD